MTRDDSTTQALLGSIPLDDKESFNQISDNIEGLPISSITLEFFNEGTPTEKTARREFQHFFVELFYISEDIRHSAETILFSLLAAEAKYTNRGSLTPADISTLTS